MTIWIKDGNIDQLVIPSRFVEEAREVGEQTETFNVPTVGYSREQWDALGYNELDRPIAREPHTSYETQWVKDDDLVYREEIIAATVDDAARTEAEGNAIRAERDRLLLASDWTQLLDCPFGEAGKTAWGEYRQGLRDVPQQAGFPGAVEWPVVS
ncbi:MAG: phage tail assembly chaperone [Pseudodesulfovibrio sp.]|nr:phage tail assembly chaperone [Pseudodesulfovibrio sp.]